MIVFLILFLFILIYFCHSDARREEDVLLSEAKNLDNVNVDVHETFRYTSLRSE